MKKFLVISDFDGTLSKEDFYKKIIYKYMPEKMNTSYIQFKNEEIKDIDFLNEIFMNMDLSEEEILEDILSLEMEKGFESVIKAVTDLGGDFIILSAGSSYYIERILADRGMGDIPVYSNPGKYIDRGIKIIPDEASPFYSERYGIDKELVVKHFREQYEYIVYVGDSAPDYKGSLLADTRFAKGELIEQYKKNHVEHIPIVTYKEIEHYINCYQDEEEMALGG